MEGLQLSIRQWLNLKLLLSRWKTALIFTTCRSDIHVLECTSELAMYMACVYPTQMKMKACSTVFWLGVFVYISDFVNTPTSINATLGYTATFNCSSTTGLIGWLVNGSLLTDISTNITAHLVGRISFLLVPATKEYNNTNVTCALAILGGDDKYSDPVILMVQGMCNLLQRISVLC